MTASFPTSDEGPNQAVLDAAYALADSRQMCCAEDLTLLVEVIRGLARRPWIVQLGAGSGTMALAILSARRDVTLWSFDNDQQALNWEEQAIINAEALPPRDEAGPVYIPIRQDSVIAGRSWNGATQIELLVIDADHSYHGVMGDMGAWGRHAELIFLHDYDGTDAPQQYPGVREAADYIWGSTTPPVYKAGWSAVFKSPWNIHRVSGG